MRNAIHALNCKAIALFAMLAIGAAALTGCEAPMQDAGVSESNLSSTSANRICGIIRPKECGGLAVGPRQAEFG